MMPSEHPYQNKTDKPSKVKDGNKPARCYHLKEMANKTKSRYK